MSIWTTRTRAVEFFAFGFVLSLLMVGAGLWLGLLVWPQPTARISGLDDLSDATASREAENAALAARIAALQAALGGNICTLDPRVTAPLGVVDPQAPVPPASVTPPGDAPTFKGTLAQLLDQATVMVLAPSSKGFTMGSGFFISPNRIVTNNHVIEDATPGQLFVVNQALGKPLHAAVLASTHSSVIGNPDFAILSVDAQPNIQPLSLTSSVEQLQPVVASGFPGIVVSNDKQFTDLMNGDQSAAPSAILTDGRISAIENSGSGTEILPHTAQLAPGNSGGPLVDQCGRVVGVDTFITASSEDAAHSNYALAASVLGSFLNANQTPATLLTDACNGAPAAPAPAAAPAAPAPAPAKPAAPTSGTPPPA